MLFKLIKGRYHGQQKKLKKQKALENLQIFVSLFYEETKDSFLDIKLVIPLYLSGTIKELEVFYSFINILQNERANSFCSIEQAEQLLKDTLSFQDETLYQLSKICLDCLKKVNNYIDQTKPILEKRLNQLSDNTLGEPEAEAIQKLKEKVSTLCDSLCSITPAINSNSAF